MSSLKNDPLGAYRFIVGVEGESAAVTAAFAQFSGVSMQVETVKVRTGAEWRGVLREIPALTTFQNVRFSKGVIGDNEFLDWILSAAPDEISAATGKDMRRTINVTAVDRNGKSAVRWTLYEAMPVQYELSEMDGMNSAVLTETIVFAITGFKRQTLP
ncbi:MAG: phage tail protein [Oscillospiraceae bacterium]|jgi:phage tail-like protein|nr:phage tail protein [Oscillospiraceae bacterium]